MLLLDMKTPSISPARPHSRPQRTLTGGRPPLRAWLVLALAVGWTAGTPRTTLAAEIVNLVAAGSNVVTNAVPGGPLALGGNGQPNTTTAPSTSAQAPSGQGSSILLQGGQVVRFPDAARFGFLSKRTFTISAHLLVDEKRPEGSSYLVNHWAYGKADRSLAVRLVAKNGVVSPNVAIRDAEDTKHVTIEPRDVSWPVGQWAHLVVVGSGEKLSFWINGTEAGTSHDIPPMRSSALPLYIGGEPSGQGLCLHLYRLKVLDTAAEASWIKNEASAKN